MTRLVMWTHLDNVAYMQKPEVKAGGFSDLAASGSVVPGLAGSAPELAPWEAQVIEECNASGFRVFKPFKTENRGTATPMMEWADSAGWSRLIADWQVTLTKVRSAGYHGIGFDDECPDHGPGSWEWDANPVRAYDEPQARDLAYLRGFMWMQATVEVWPGVDLMNFFQFWPGAQVAWNQHVGKAMPYPVTNPKSLQFDWWRGLLDAGHYGRVDFLNAGFYKGHGFAPPEPYVDSDDSMAEFDVDKSHEWWRANLQREDTALHEDLFVAISPLGAGMTDYQNELSTAEAASLLTAGARVSDLVGVYHSGNKWPYVRPSDGATFTYRPYIPILQSVAMTPAPPSQAPVTTAPPPATTGVQLTGTVSNSSGTKESRFLTVNIQP